MTKLSELARVLRTKSAGPFIMTIDIFFKDRPSYEAVKNSGVITKEFLAKAYGMQLKDVLGVYFVDQALGMKASIMKKIPTGDPGCSDYYYSQQHAPLLNVEISTKN